MKTNEKQCKYTIEDGKHINEVIVSWIITHGCQEKCGYCISPCKTTEINLKKEHFIIQDKLIQGGVTKNRYIGGEPLLVPHITELIKDAYKKGIDTRLSTNGRLLTETKFKELKPYLSSVALPFETMNNSLNKIIRGIDGHRDIIASRISMIKERGI
ncbi:MAG: radical SAM protein [Clostridia bacterium]|nr:radical SAM protein [Clostridia bacterium]